MRFNIMQFKETESTNLLAGKLASEGAPEGTVVVAERQTGGRGRLDRKWHSPEGGLWFSVVLRPCRLADAHMITMAAGISVTESLRALGVDAKIKWPNDVLIDGKKVCGMLSEAALEGGRLLFTILGIGINTNLEGFPPEIPDAVSLSTLLGRKIGNAALLANVLEQFDALRQKSAAEIAEKWTELSGTIGKRVRVKTGGNGETIEGVAERMDPDGALVVDGKRILVGDCEYLRAMDNGASDNVIKLRGHHLLCIFGFRGRGYDEKFVENMGRIVAALKEKETRIVVVEGCDDICALCPSRRGSACFLKGHKSDMEIREQDADVLARLEMAPGNEIPACDLPRMVASRIKPSDLKSICRGCNWLALGFCEEGIRKCRI